MGARDTVLVHDARTFGSCSSASTLSRPSSINEAPPSRSGSKHSMTRLPDEARGPPARERSGPSWGKEEQYLRGQFANHSPGVAVPASRPSSAHRRHAGVVSPACCGSRPGSTGKSRKASLVKLPDEAAPVSQQRRPSSAVSKQRRSSSACHISASGCTASASSGDLPKASGDLPKASLKDRMGKNLTIATTRVQSSVRRQPTSFLVLAANQTIDELFEFDRGIQNGGDKNNKVMVARRRRDGMEVIVKIRAKHPNVASDRSWRAIMSQVLSMGGSRHVLNILDIIEGTYEYYIVMPKCDGGELFDFLATEEEVPERECKRIIREILTAAGHLHKNNLIHRDIKPENIMFDLGVNNAQASPKTVKLIDFDTCLEWTPLSPKSSSFVGTPGYIAPEALMGQSSPQSDLWSIGVILYILMTGEMPWSHLVSLEGGVVGSPGALHMYSALRTEVMDWDQEPWPQFPMARDLGQKLLAFETSERLQSVEAALSHPWLAGG